jgi:nicotinamidase-related amidase
MSKALVVIDVQNEYVTGGLPIAYPPVAGSLERIGAAIDAANANGVPVILVRHQETEEGSTIFVAGTDGWQLHEAVASRPHNAVVDKTLPGAYTGTDLADVLADASELAIIGYMTHMCIDTTSRQANHLGLEVTVLSDATGTINLSDELPAELVHRVELGVLASGFANVVTTDEWIATL